MLLEVFRRFLGVLGEVFGRFLEGKSRNNLFDEIKKAIKQTKYPSSFYRAVAVIYIYIYMYIYKLFFV